LIVAINANALVTVENKLMVVQP